MKIILAAITVWIISIVPCNEHFDKKIYNLKVMDSDSTYHFSRTIMPNNWKQCGDSLVLGAYVYY